jgi:hypothetical protein
MKSYRNFLTPALLLSAAMVSGCLEKNPSQKLPCYTPDYNIVSAMCNEAGEFCSSTRVCVAADNTTDPYYPRRVEGELAVTFPINGSVVEGNLLIVPTVPPGTVQVGYWVVDDKGNEALLGQSGYGAFPWKSQETGAGAVQIYLRAFDDKGGLIAPYSPRIRVVVQTPAK